LLPKIIFSLTYQSIFKIMGDS